MKIAIAQLNPTIGDLVGNAARILEAAKKAEQAGVRLLLTPELSLCGYPPRDLLLKPSFVAAMLDQLERLAKQLPGNIAVLVGTVQPNPLANSTGGKPLYNSIACLQNGKIDKIFHKRLLPTYDVFDEDRYFQPASASNFFTLDAGNLDASPAKAATPGVKIGVTICEDLWNDEEFWGKRNYASNPIADLAEEGVDLLVNLSASPYTVGKQKLRESMLRHGATRYRKPVIYANQVGGNDDLIFDGCSVAFNRAGELVGRARYFETDFLVLEFDETSRDLSMPESPYIAPNPSSEDEEIFAALVLGVRDYARKCGFSQAVIGLSGGIDSSLVAAIAAFALGSENVLGVLMPSPYSSDHSVTDALELAENLGIQTHTLSIGNLMGEYDKCLSDIFAGLPADVTEENLQSRIRGNLLMAIANKFGHLLLSTGNKSEMAVGYCTLYGDMNGGLAAIADVPKTRVYSICSWLNASIRVGGQYPVRAKHPVDNLSASNQNSWQDASPLQDKNQKPNQNQNQNRAIIPENILTKAPSAELKPGQIDQDSLPPYEILDDILHRLVEKHESPAEIEAAGGEPATIERVMKLLARAEFKRRQAPPGLKVTDRAFGTGWRMPIAARSRYSSSQISVMNET